jgi:hypothetical protein
MQKLVFIFVYYYGTVKRRKGTPNGNEYCTRVDSYWFITKQRFKG